LGIFVQFLKVINERKGISKNFVDEVHHLLEAEKPGFRPCLGKFWMFRNKLFTVNVHALVVGLTATLIRSDIPRLRELITGIQGYMPSFRRSCYRSSVQFQVGWMQTDSVAQERCIRDSSALVESVTRSESPTKSQPSAIAPIYKASRDRERLLCSQPFPPLTNSSNEF
jgi:hypothetical protein